MTSSWYSAQALPRSTSSLVTVFLAAPVMRTVARRLLPSTSEAMICARFSVVSRFILTIMPERIGIVKQLRAYFSQLIRFISYNPPYLSEEPPVDRRSMETKEFIQRQQLVSRAFRPAAPVDDEALFAGRTTQMVRLLDV